MSFLSHLSQPLLQGTYGVVYKARDTRNHNIVAMKKVQLRGSDREVIKDQFDQVGHSINNDYHSINNDYHSMFDQVRLHTPREALERKHSGETQRNM